MNIPKVGQRWRWIWDDTGIKVDIISEILFIKKGLVMGEILQVIEATQNQYVIGAVINSNLDYWKNNKFNTFILLPNQNAPEEI